MSRSFGIDTTPMPFVDLAAQRRRLGAKIDDAILRIIERGDFIMGVEVARLEEQLAAFCGAKKAVACANGTDALGLALMALKLRPGEAVLCPSFTFAATAEVVAWFGAVPVFVDVRPDTYNMDPASLEAGIATAAELGLRPVGVIPVDLFGQPADYEKLLPIAEANGLWVLCDAAQSFGATHIIGKVGTIGVATAVSFFPAKPLGCYGDGGVILTDDDELAATMRSLSVHGQGADKYDNVRAGMNSRLDTIQAAILLEKLTIFQDEIEARDRVAARYTASLSDLVSTPSVLSGCRSAWAQYTVRVPSDRRAETMQFLKDRGIPSAIYYPKPLHRQEAYGSYPVARTGLPITEALAGDVLSLPMHPYLELEAQDRIVEAMRAALSRLAA
ncbi:DegT/DnrJ/EryC1/StrS family aminotransferase [Methylobacterium nigriterrae]|uniref:DegT/DnrJ/EryC1/StrS family aminotransferase n=1 Tax=Methylobacterium nigriterrae TaxID=3127512 RepID=UPI0030133ABD